MSTTKWLALLLLATASGAAEEFRFESAGARVGFSVNNRTKDLHQADIVATWNIPLDCQITDHWRLRTRLDMTAGWIGGPGDDAFVTSGGLSFAVERERFPLWLEIGLSPTLLSREVIGRTDFGSHLQFTSHAGLNWDIGSHFRVGYRLQHMSNGSLSTPNPGLNQHVFSASYRF